MDSRFYPQSKNSAAVSGKDASIVQAAIYAPSSGPTGTGAGVFAWPACLLYCTSSKALFVNEGTLASPYWMPVSFDQRGLLGGFTNFRNAIGKAHANTDTSADLENGVKVSGQGIAETDSGLVITFDELGRIGRLTATNEDLHQITLSASGTAAVFQPDTHGPFVVDTEFTNVAAITLRDVFVGFCGANSNELDPIVTATTVTVTIAATIGDDFAGIFMGSALTDAAGLMCIHDKGNANATLLTTAAGVDSGKDMPVAATYGRFRVECDAAGNVRYFFNKEQIGYTALGLDADEEVGPLFYLGSSSTAVKIVDMKHFSYWGVRP